MRRRAGWNAAATASVAPATARLDRRRPTSCTTTAPKATRPNGTLTRNANAVIGCSAGGRAIGLRQAPSWVRLASGAVRVSTTEPVTTTTRTQGSQRQRGPARRPSGNSMGTPMVSRYQPTLRIDAPPSAHTAPPPPPPPAPAGPPPGPPPTPREPTPKAPTQPPHRAPPPTTNHPPLFP